MAMDRIVMFRGDGHAVASSDMGGIVIAPYVSINDRYLGTTLSYIANCLATRDRSRTIGTHCTINNANYIVVGSSWHNQL